MTEGAGNKVAASACKQETALWLLLLGASLWGRWTFLVPSAGTCCLFQRTQQNSAALLGLSQAKPQSSLDVHVGLFFVLFLAQAVASLAHVGSSRKTWRGKRLVLHMT